VYCETVTSARHLDSEALDVVAMAFDEFGEGLELLVVRTTDVTVHGDVTCH
jgi:hypothetical protein